MEQIITAPSAHTGQLGEMFQTFMPQKYRISADWVLGFMLFSGIGLLFIGIKPVFLTYPIPAAVALLFALIAGYLAKRFWSFSLQIVELNEETVASARRKRVISAIFAALAVTSGIWALGFVHFGLIPLAIGAFLISIPIREWIANRSDPSNGAVLYAEGFTYTCQGETEIIKWSDVEHFYLGSGLETGELDFDLKRYKRKVSVEIANLQDYRALVEAIDDKITDAQWTNAVERFEAGEKLDFEPFKLSQDGLWCEGQLFHWRDIASVGPNDDDNTMEIKDRNGKITSFDTMPDFMPDYSLFIGMVQDILDQEPASRK